MVTPSWVAPKSGSPRIFRPPPLRQVKTVKTPAESAHFLPARRPAAKMRVSGRTISCFEWMAGNLLAWLVVLNDGDIRSN